MPTWISVLLWSVWLLFLLPMDAKESLFTLQQRQQLATKVETILVEKRVQVALLARMGRPQAEMPAGMHFTHVGFVVNTAASSQETQTASRYITYNMYQQEDRPDVSALEQDTPLAFFAHVAELEAGLIIPSPGLQKRLLTVIHSASYQALHDPRYSLIANPYTLGKQNCTEFVLDVISAALYQTTDIQQIKTREQTHFTAQRIHVSPFRLYLAALFKAEISLSDQSDPPVTATFETIGSFLQQNDTQTERLTVRHD